MKTEEIPVLGISSKTGELLYIVKKNGGDGLKLFRVVPAKFEDYKDLLGFNDSKNTAPNE